MKQSFDDIIREKTKGYEAPVPPGAWDNITKGKRKKRRFIFLWWILAALLGGGAVVLYNFSGKDKTVSNPQTISQRSNTPDNSSSGNSEKANAETSATNSETNVTDSNNDEAVNQKGSAIVNTETANAINIVTNENTTTGFAINTGAPVKSKRPADNKQPGFAITNSSPAKGKKTKNDNDGNVIDNPVQQDQSIIAVTTAHPGKETTITDQPVINNTIIDLATTNTINEVKNNPKDTASVTDSQQTIAETPSIKLKKRTGNWKVDVAVMPLLSLQQNSALQELKRTSTEGMVKREFIADKTETTIEPGIAFNIALRKKINAKTHIGAGIQYATFKEKVYLSGTETVTTSSIVKRLEKDVNGVSFLVDDTVEAVTTGQRTIRALNSYQTISLPVFIQTNLLQKRSYSIDLSAGVYLNLSRSYQNSISGTFTNSYTSGLKQGTSQTATGIDIFTSLRFSTPWRKNWSLFAEPMLRYSFLRNNIRNMINAKYIHQAGVFLGISRSF